jgi:hypothetical protein
MSELESALQRLGDAVKRLETAMDEQDETAGDAPEVEIPAVVAERDHLANEVEKLQARADEDKLLRAEAADAVRQALIDLRGAVGQGAPANA